MVGAEGSRILNSRYVRDVAMWAREVVWCGRIEVGNAKKHHRATLASGRLVGEASADDRFWYISGLCNTSVVSLVIIFCHEKENLTCRNG